MPDPISGVISGVSDLANVGVNIYNAYKQNEQYNYQKALQKQIFKREDNAVARRVADMRRSGLSPVLAAGAPAQSGAVVKTDAPQLDSFKPGSASMRAQLLQMDKEFAVKDQEIQNMKAARQGTNLDNLLKSIELAKIKDAGVSAHPGVIGRTIADVQGAIGHAFDVGKDIVHQISEGMKRDRLDKFEKEYDPNYHDPALKPKHPFKKKEKKPKSKNWVRDIDG